MKKLKATLLVIDLLLAAAVIAAGLYCLEWFQAVDSIPDPEECNLKAEQLVLDAAALEEQIKSRKQEVARLEADGEAAYTAAEGILKEKQDSHALLSAQRDNLQAQLDSINNAETVIKEKQEALAALRVAYGTAVRQLEDKILAGESQYKICYLTFDDGPSYYTNRFLEKLDELDIYVTFFTIGKQMASRDYALRDQYLRWQATSGHSIQNHTYTHAIHDGLYSSVNSFISAVKKQDDVVFNATGLHTDVVRFPAGSYYCKNRKATIAELEKQGYGWIDWSGNAYDSGSKEYSSGYTARTVIWQVRQEQISVVLMHDWRLGTLEALDTIVPTLQAENYLFLPLFKESSTIGNTKPKWDN